MQILEALWSEGRRLQALSFIVKKICEIFALVYNLPGNFSVNLLFELNKHWSQHAQFGTTSGNLQQGKDHMFFIFAAHQVFGLKHDAFHHTCNYT